MPVAKVRVRTCQWCGTEYTLGVDSTQHKYCSIKCRNAWHYNRWRSNGGKRCKKKVHAYWLKHQYGITPEEKFELLDTQGGDTKVYDGVFR